MGLQPIKGSALCQQSSCRAGGGATEEETKWRTWKQLYCTALVTAEKNLSLEGGFVPGQHTKNIHPFYKDMKGNLKERLRAEPIKRVIF